MEVQEILKKKITFKGQRGGDGERSVSAQALES